MRRAIAPSFPELVKANENAAIVAGTDIWKVNREVRSGEIASALGAAPKQFSSYEDLLTMKDSDAVLIAMPDMTHPRILMDAVAAGKTSRSKSRSPRISPMAKRHGRHSPAASYKQAPSGAAHPNSWVRPRRSTTA